VSSAAGPSAVANVLPGDDLAVMELYVLWCWHVARSLQADLECPAES